MGFNSAFKGLITLSTSKTEFPQTIYCRIVKLLLNNNKSEIIFEEVVFGQV
jgi:hypothetical protein